MGHCFGELDQIRGYYSLTQNRHKRCGNLSKDKILSSFMEKSHPSRILISPVGQSQLVCLSLVMLWASQGWAAPAEAAGPGDRRPEIRRSYPESAFFHAGKGGRLIDVTKPPFNAKGDGVTDDTKALVAAMDYVASSRVPGYCYRDFSKGGYLLYFSNGTYLVSDSIQRSLPVWVGDCQWADHRQYQISSDDELKDKTRFPAGMNSNEQNDTIVFIGQDRAKTIIKLKDNSPGFEAGKSKPLIRFYWLRCGSNVNQDNVIEGMTLDTGRGNPGAVAVLWNSSNFGAIRNLTVRSGDGLGVAGILSDARNAQGLFENITVDGFQKGISIVSSSATLVAMDHLTFRNQTSCAIHVGNGSRIALRKGRTEGAPVAIHVEDGSQATIVDSEFKATEKTGTAVILKDSHLFARNILISGYGAAIEQNGKVVVASGGGAEYVSSTPLNPNGLGSPITSVPFPWVDEPYIPHETDSRNWAVVDDYGALGDAKTDDTAAIQAAMKSGKPAILFPKICYVVNGTVDIPATVRQISFLYGHTIRSERSDAAMFNIAEASAAPLLIQQNINLGGLFLDHTAVRPLVLRDSHTHFWFHFGGNQPYKAIFPWTIAMPSLETNHWRMYRNATPDKRKTVFVSNVHGFAGGGPKLAGAVDNVLAYCRWVNTEHEVVNFSFRRSDVGILGCKLEMDGTHFYVSDGTKLEVLGGIYYQGGPNRTPVVIAKDSTISMSFSAFGGHNPADVILENWTGDVKQTIQRTDCPLLDPRNKNMPAIPLMVNTKAEK